MDRAATVNDRTKQPKKFKNSQSYKKYLVDSVDDDNSQLLLLQRTSQESMIPINASINDDELHWYSPQNHPHSNSIDHISCDKNLYQTSNSNLFLNNATTTTANNSEISFTKASDMIVGKNELLNKEHASSYTGKNFDIHLAQIDIETFKSEDIEKIRFNHSLAASNDTLRIVDSIGSFTADHHLHLPPDDYDGEALSIDSLDISVENEINSKLIEKCSQRDKTRYKLTVIDNSVHSQTQNSMINSENYDFLCNNNNHNNNNNINESKNPFMPNNHHRMENGNQNSECIQSPGSLVRMFMQNRIDSENESSMLSNHLSKSNHREHQNIGNYFNNSDTRNNNNDDNYLTKCDTFLNQHHQMTNNESFNTENDESSLNTIDSNDLPLHVLDLSKKLRALNLSANQHPYHQQKSPSKTNQKYHQNHGSTSMSSTNNSYTSATSGATTSSSATNNEAIRQLKQHHKSTHNQNNNSSNRNPFLSSSSSSNNNNRKSVKSAATQFPDLFQDKEVQASFDYDSEAVRRDSCSTATASTPQVLVYYPNYSLPDLSFLKDIFKPTTNNDKINSPAAVYLSPIKHEPPKTTGIITGNYYQHSQNPSVRYRETRKVGQPTGTYAKPKCRPKSLTSYETLLANQDLSHIKDWDSLNLLLPDDFKEFIQQNNLLDRLITKKQPEQDQIGGQSFKLTNSNRLLQHHGSVKLRSQSTRQQNQHHHGQQTNKKRYSLQEFERFSNNNNNHHHLRMVNDQDDQDEECDENDDSKLYDINSFMTRSQTMPNCRVAFNPHVACYPHPSNVPASIYPHQPCCCHNMACCGHHPHSSAGHSPPHTQFPNIQQQQAHFNKNSASSSLQSSPPKLPVSTSQNHHQPNLNWDILSSSSSFKKLIYFLNKLEDSDSATHSESILRSHNPNDKVDLKLTFNNRPNTSNNLNRQLINNETQQSINKLHRRNTVNQPVYTRKQSTKKTNQYQQASNKNFKDIKSSVMTSKQNKTTSTRNSEKPKIILKRPASLNKQHSTQSSHSSTSTITTAMNSSRIPVPKRISSMIPVLNQQETMVLNNHPNQNHHHLK